MYFRASLEVLCRVIDNNIQISYNQNINSAKLNGIKCKMEGVLFMSIYDFKVKT